MEVWNHPFPWRLIYCSFEKYSSDFLKPTSKSNWQQEHQIYGFQLHVQAAGGKTPARRAYQFIKEDEKGNRCQLNDQLRYSINCQMQDIEAFIPSCFQFPLSMPSASAQEFRGSWCWDRHAKAKYVSMISRSRFGLIWNLGNSVRDKRTILPDRTRIWLLNWVRQCSIGARSHGCTLVRVNQSSTPVSNKQVTNESSIGVVHDFIDT